MSKKMRKITRLQWVTRISLVLSSMALVVSTPLFAQTYAGSLETLQETSVQVSRLDKTTSTFTRSHGTINHGTRSHGTINHGTKSHSGFISPERVNKSLTRPINDFTNTLKTSEKQQLEKKIRQVHDSGLLQIGVVLVPTTGDMSTFDYAMTIAKSWQLGSPENNNGVLLLIAMNDRDIYILTGLDADDILADDFIKQVIDTQITPNFRKSQYAEGIDAGLDALVMQMNHMRMNNKQSTDSIILN